MAWPHDARTPTNLNAPEPVGWCDRCYRKFYLAELDWQYDVRGRAVVDIGVMVCPDCTDEPALMLMPPLIIGPEGVVRDTRPPNYAQNFLGGTQPPTDLSGEGVPRPHDIPDDTFQE